MSTYRSATNKIPDSFDNCPHILNRYLQYLSVFENKRAASVLETYICLREFFQYIHYCNVIQENPPTRDAHKDMDISQMELSELCEISNANIEDYLFFLDNISRNALSTVCKKFSYIQAFFDYLVSNAQELGGCLPEGNPASHVRKPKPPKNDSIRILSIEQINRLASAATGATAARDAAIILLIASTGLTISEIAALDRQDLHEGSGVLHIRDESGKRRIFCIPPACMDKITDYLAVLDAENASLPLPTALFVGRRNKRLTTRGIQKRIAMAASVANMSTLNITAQSLRDTAIVNLLKDCTLIQQQQILDNLNLHDNRTFLRYINAIPAATPALDEMESIVANSPVAQLGI